MYYGDYPVYFIANTPEEGKSLEKKGYTVERWPPEKMKDHPNEPHSK